MMDDLRFFVLFNSILVISGRWTDDDDEKLCATEPRLRLKSSPPHVRLEPRVIRSVDQWLTY